MDLLKKYIKQVIALGVLVLLILSFIGGCATHRKLFKCPKMTIDTIMVIDSFPKIIRDSFPYYTSKQDTVFYWDTVFYDVDTAAILRDYFALHIYNRQWKDSLIRVNLSDTITQNRPIGNFFEYRILRPQTIINNSVDNTITYNWYWTAGIDFPIKNIDYLEFESTFHFSRWYIGAGYTPQLKSADVKIGATILKFKHKTK
jgi:hypothetical protein